MFLLRANYWRRKKVFEIDITKEIVKCTDMIKSKSGFSNVEHKLGNVKELLIESNITDFVFGNYFINILQDMDKKFSEIFVILKPEGDFCISDVVIQDVMSKEFIESLGLYTD